MTVLITGAAGSIGTALAAWLPDAVRTDIDTLDVENRRACIETVYRLQPDLIYHLAGAKHAPEGERDPAGVAATNITGTHNIVVAAAQCNAKVVMASTCKACNPETAYGASKLIAERMVLNAGHVVARFFNVMETSGNVFQIWDQIPEDEPLPVTPGRRYWVSLEQTVSLLLACAELPSGRYACDPGDPIWVVDMAAGLYPGRELRAIPLRRGDRPLEPLHAMNERVRYREDGLLEITSTHDAAQVLV